MSPKPFGRYLLLDEIAHGGMAAVYRAVLRENTSGFEKHVALKRMLKDLNEDPEFIARFTDEARIVSTLNHANIAQVFDFGQVDGEYYLVMELIDGPDLGSLLTACIDQQHPVPIPTTVHIVAAMARGLGAAHTRHDTNGGAAPVVHRDVSPHNVLISRAGAVKVVDFGIAQAAEKALRTRPGMVMGKCRYMAPEQALGDDVDVRADVFATGSILFEMLTGGPLFPGDEPAQLMQMVVEQPIPIASTVNPDVPPELDEILAQCLARPREQRYPNGSALARELEALLHRMAPDFSCDDLAGFVHALVPQRALPVEAPTVPQTEPELGFSDTDVATTPSPALEPHDTVPDAPPQSMSAPAIASSVGGTDTRPGSVISLETGPLTASPPSRPRRLLLLSVGLGLSALFLGGMVRYLAHGSSPEALSPGASVQMPDGLSLRLTTLKRIQRNVKVVLTVIPEKRAGEVTGDWFALDGEAARFTSRPVNRPSQLTLVFGPASQRPLLVLLRPGVEPRQFRLSP